MSSGTKVKQKLDSAKHTEQYTTIKKAAESQWPSWKVNVYNESVAISAHAKKIKA